MKGNVLFFDVNKGFGKLSTNEGTPREVFVHISNIIGDAKILIDGEEVEFDLTDSKKGFSASNVKRKIDRKVGTIETFDYGYGFAKEDSGTVKYFIHHSEVLGFTGFKNIEVGFDIEFTPDSSDKGPKAKDIVLRDSRPALQKFARFENWNEAISDLANLAQNEDGNWDYIKRKTGGYPVLSSYITHTFARLQKEGKIRFASKNEKGKEIKYACFNTGLATSKQEDIFAYFESDDRNSKEFSYLNRPLWIFKCFDRESNRIMNSFPEKPELANYFQQASELIYDTEKRLIPDYDHILDDREGRFPDDFVALSKPQQVERVKSAIDSALIRVRRNYKTAIPQFYKDAIQLLLPLCITTAENADIALVVAREGEVYRANTVLPLDWAYNNARLLAKPDREWLNP